MDGPHKIETFTHKLSAYAGHGHKKHFYIGIACYDNYESAKEAVENRGIGPGSHHVDDDMNSEPIKIFFTYKMSKKHGCELEQELIQKYIHNKRCLNKKLGSDSCSPYHHLVVYCRIYT